MPLRKQQQKIKKIFSHHTQKQQQKQSIILYQQQQFQLKFYCSNLQLNNAEFIQKKNLMQTMKNIFK
jgi:hypothetical protein